VTTNLEQQAEHEANKRLCKEARTIQERLKELKRHMERAMARAIREDDDRGCRHFYQIVESLNDSEHFLNRAVTRIEELKP
jgi:hypothetical protein